VETRSVCARAHVHEERDAVWLCSWRSISARLPFSAPTRAISGNEAKAVFAVEPRHRPRRHQARARKGGGARSRQASGLRCGGGRPVPRYDGRDRAAAVAEINRSGNAVRPRPRCVSPAFQPSSPYHFKTKAPSGANDPEPSRTFGEFVDFDQSSSTGHLQRMCQKGPAKPLKRRPGIVAGMMTARAGKVRCNTHLAR